MDKTHEKKAKGKKQGCNDVCCRDTTWMKPVVNRPPDPGNNVEKRSTPHSR